MAQQAPISNWPSLPMLKTPARNEETLPRPIGHSGMIRTAM